VAQGEGLEFKPQYLKKKKEKKISFKRYFQKPNRETKSQRQVYQSQEASPE
jgi:hypothetical protein